MSKRKESATPLDTGTSGRTSQKRKGEKVPDEGKRRKVEGSGTPRPACDACGRILGTTKHVKCEALHLVCGDCLEEGVQEVFVHDLDVLTCPVRGCQHGFTPDELSRLKPSIVIDMVQVYFGIIDNSSVNWVFAPHRCPGCQSLAPDNGSILLRCPFLKCGKSHCNYCQELYAKVPVFNNLYIQHFGCSLLTFDDPGSIRNGALVPTLWETSGQDRRGFCRVNVPLDSLEGVQVVNFYNKTSDTYKVTGIERIENKAVWQRYVTKREEMISSFGAENISERFMFHGSAEFNTENICLIGFDITKANSYGVYGRGIYFSTSSSLSQRHANKYLGSLSLAGQFLTPNSVRVFIGRVLLGRTQTGRKGQIKNLDSRVDNAFYCGQCVVFSSEQTYPAYLVDASLV